MLMCRNFMDYFISGAIPKLDVQDNTVFIADGWQGR